MNKKKEKQLHVAMYSFIVILFIALVFYTQKAFLYWDEVVYIGISKYLFYGGNAGLFEMIRPPIVGFVLIPLAWIPESPVILYRFIALFTTFCLLGLMYHLAKTRSTKRGGLSAVVVLALMSVFITYSFRISAGILALLFMFISLWFIRKKRYAWAGLFAGITFLTRFPMGTYAFSLGVIFVFKLFYDMFAIKVKRNKKKKLIIIIKKFFKKSLLLFMGFIIPTLIYFTYNIITNPAKPIVRAALDPFFYASTTITGGHLWMYEQGIFYYVIELLKQMPFLILVPFAICALIWVQVKTKKFLFLENILIFFTIITFLYFSQLAHKELRYALVFLPTACMLISFGIHQVCETLKKQKLKAYLFNTLLVLLMLFAIIAIFIYNPLGLFLEEEFPAEKLYSFECYKFLEQYTDEPVVATTPFPVVFVSNRVHPSYYTLTNVAKLYKDHSFLILTPKTFPCAEDDKMCRIQNDAIIYEMIKESDVLYYDQTPMRECLVLAKKEVQGVSEEQKQQLKQTVLERFRYQDNVDLSITPYAKTSSVMLVFNDIVVMNEEEIWKQNEFSAITTLLQQKEIPYTLAVIPKNLHRLDEDRLFVLQRLAEREQVDIVQKGFDYTARESEDSFAGLPLSDQRERIWTGKAYVYKYLFIDPNSFFVPYGKSDQNTINVLKLYNYSNILTSANDPVNTDTINRFNVGVETVTDWENTKIQDIQELRKQTELKNLMPYILINFYYYSFDEQSIPKISGYIDWLNDTYHLTTIAKYTKWEERINAMQYKLTDEEFIIQNVSQYRDMPIGLEIRSEVNMMTNFYPLYVRNIGLTKNQVCINDECAALEIEETHVFNAFPQK